LSRVGAAGTAVMILGVAVLSLTLLAALSPGDGGRPPSRVLLLFLLAAVSLGLVLIGVALIALSLDLDQLFNELRRGCEQGGGRRV